MLHAGAGRDKAGSSEAEDCSVLSLGGAHRASEVEPAPWRTDGKTKASKPRGLSQGTLGIGRAGPQGLRCPPLLPSKQPGSLRLACGEAGPQPHRPGQRQVPPSAFL